MSAPTKRQRPAGTGRRQVEQGNNRTPILPPRPPVAQVGRLRLTARCLSFVPVFVNDAPLTAELFDAAGMHAETWQWPPL